MTVPRCLLFALLVLGVAVPVAAQPWREFEPLRRDIFSLEEAIRIANESHRVLIVYPKGSPEAARARTIAALDVLGITGDGRIARTITDGFTLMEERTWAHPGLRTFINDHAIVYTVAMSGEQSSEFQELMRETERPLDGHPHAMVYIGTTRHALLPPGNPDEWKSRKIRGGNISRDPRAGVLDPSRWFPKPEQVLFEAMSAMDRKRATDPVWGMLHDQKNPPPVVKIQTFYHRQTALSDGFREPLEADLEFALQTWSDARRWAGEGEYARAIAAYTWLWERGSEVAPELDGVRSWLLASEMADLARERPEASVRFAEMHDAMGERWMHLSNEQWIDYFTLGEVVGRQAWNLDYLVGNTVGWFASEKTTPGDLPMLSAAEKVKFDLLASRDSWSGDDSDPRAAIDRARRYSELLNTLDSQNATPAEIGDAVAIYRRVLRHEASRAHAMLLAEGDAATAAELAEWYIKQERLGKDFARATLAASAHAVIMNPAALGR